jgi:hypothetical protein
MKDILMFVMGLLLASNFVNAQQQIDNNTISKASLRTYFYAGMNTGNFIDSATQKDEYLKKSKNQKTVAWVMLGGGLAVGIAGVIVFNQSDWFSEDDSQTNTGGIMFLAGACTALGSIPFFISSSHNAKKAAAISFKNQELFFPRQDGILVKSQPAVSLKIKL